MFPKVKPINWLQIERSINTTMKLLLHACCGPCSLEPYRLLAEEGHDITIFFSNANIEPTKEYQHRLDTLLDWAHENGIPVVSDDWGNDEWRTRIEESWSPEDPRARRCRACYRFRLERAATYAHESGFEALGTTLAVSPYQLFEVCGEELAKACSAFPGLTPIHNDYRPYYPEATTRSRELGMYRQNYCGCHWSIEEAKADRERRKLGRKKAKELKRKEKLRNMKTDDFDYDLPEELIAQEPAPIRDECKMLVMRRDTGAIEDRIFKDIEEYLQPGDLLVANETRVMPARLLGQKRGTGGSAEVFLLRERFDVEPKKDSSAIWEVLVRPGKRLKPGSGAVVDFADEDGGIALSAEVIDWVEGGQKGERLARLSTTRASLDEALHAVGHTPLPPYIKGYAGNEEMYQTVYSREEKSAAAPTAGLHFTPELIERLKAKGVEWETVHLEVGLDTFRVVDEENPRDHAMHTEFYTVPQRTVDAIKACKERGGRVVAVGTTSVRSLESAWDAQNNELRARDHESTQLFILPGYEFHVVDQLITNFHVPRSTLMMLVSAFSTRDNVMRAYRHAIKRRYRMLSFGDAMFIRL